MIWNKQIRVIRKAIFVIRKWRGVQHTSEVYNIQVFKILQLNLDAKLPWKQFVKVTRKVGGLSHLYQILKLKDTRKTGVVQLIWSRDNHRHTQTLFMGASFEGNTLSTSYGSNNEICTNLMWVFKVLFSLNRLKHRSHLKGLSPVCTLSWRTTLDGASKRFSQ